jgi:hypothetical protein
VTVLRLRHAVEVDAEPHHHQPGAPVLPGVFVLVDGPILTQKDNRGPRLQSPIIYILSTYRSVNAHIAQWSLFA